MPTLATILVSIGAFLFVYLVSWLLSLYMRAKPWEQPEPTQRPKPSHEIARQIVRKIRRGMNERN